jgi:uncharacterized protein (TIGR02611 family)
VTDERAERHPMIQKLHRRREAHRDRHPAIRVGVAALGVLVTLAGIVTTGPVPGPGILIIPVGLALLALEFTWAERLLEKVLVWVDNARDRAARRSRGERIATGVAIALVLAAFVAAAILWDVPLLPV